MAVRGDAARAAGGDAVRGAIRPPRHSVRLNLLTRFQAALAAPRPSPSSSSSSAPSSSSVRFFFFFFSSWLYDYLRLVRPSVRPTLHRGISAGI